MNYFDSWCVREGGSCSSDINKSLSSIPISFDSVDHKVHIVSPLFGIGTPPPPPPPPPVSVSSPPWTGGGGGAWGGGGGGRASNFGRLKKKPSTLCTLWRGSYWCRIGKRFCAVFFAKIFFCCNKLFFYVRFTPIWRGQNNFHPSKNVSQKRGRLRGKIMNTLSAKITIKLYENALLKLKQYYRSQHFSYAFRSSGQTRFAESTTSNSFF